MQDKSSISPSPQRIQTRNGDRIKVAALGMHLGSAKNRLVKMIIFDLLRRLDECRCFQCGKEITSIEDLSIEHKKAWASDPATLYWDLDNIAFSHLVCNRRAGSKEPRVSRRKTCPVGESWCSVCKQCLPIDHFFRTNNPRWANPSTGVHPRCKDCKNRAARKAKPL